MPNRRQIGVLALQGDFREHLSVLQSLDVNARPVRLAEDLRGLAGLVIPGGESTTIARLADIYGLRAAIVEAAVQGMAVWGTCAGMILVARSLVDPVPAPFGLMNIKVARNWYGRQVDSFEADLQLRGAGPQPFRGVFIRAPAVVEVGAEVEVLASLEDDSPVAVRQGRILATAFHPELTGDSRVHDMFATLARD